MITAKIVADSINPFDDRLTSMLVTCPRIILAEFNTHRAFSRNSASSRAIPFKKMLKSVLENPFIPIAWQKDHKGMQGTEYLSGEEEHKAKTFWIQSLQNQISYAKLISGCNTTKQLCNRLLEPFMWHTILVSSTEWENFFALRCPRYEVDGKVYRSKKDANKANNNFFLEDNPLDWLKLNRGQAEIHIMALAEAMWDAYNESTPKKLNPGEWHIPFEDNIREICLTSEDDFELTSAGLKVKISTAMAARTSYTVVGDEREITYSDLRRIHNKMRVANPFHASPFEHCAMVPILEEHYRQEYTRNFTGFMQYRAMIENQLI